ncbi:MAG: response regulator transcription factor [Clostridiales bacterium]|nr:response regulator transcription factor [Clostridiales bacterium]
MRLLLAEDERELSNALSAILKHNNYSVDTVYNGQDAVDYLDTQLYDGAVLDIMMPKKDGITVLREIRAKGNTLPVLLLTAKSGVDDRVLGLDSGADDYLTKPFSTKELLARVRAMLRRGGDATDNILNFGNIKLNRATYELSTPKSAFRLANKEFQIMEMLIANPGQVIATERFMDKIWGYDSDAELNVVWVYISYLRKKLKSLGADVKIVAKRNLGYCLEESHD